MAVTPIGKFRHYRDKFAMRGDFRVSAAPAQLQTQDGVRVFATLLKGTGSAGFVVVHGLGANHRASGFREFAESLIRYGPVMTIDLRGHGLSSGACTLGHLEAFDVAAATDEARKRWDIPVAVIGFSMGSAAAVRAAALYSRPDAVVAVSGPAEWSGWRRRRARRTSLIWRLPGGKILFRAFSGVRIARSWEKTETPISVVDRIAPVPLLVVHGVDDTFFPPEEARRLVRAAGGPNDLWLIEEGGHAESLFTEPGEPVSRSRVDAFADGIVSRLRVMGFPVSKP